VIFPSPQKFFPEVTMEESALPSFSTARMSATFWCNVLAGEPTFPFYFLFYVVGRLLSDGESLPFCALVFFFLGSPVFHLVNFPRRLPPPPFPSQPRIMKAYPHPQGFTSQSPILINWSSFCGRRLSWTLFVFVFCVLAAVDTPVPIPPAALFLQRWWSFVFFLPLAGYCGGKVVFFF